MPLITDEQLRKTIDLPIGLPATRLDAGDWLVVGTVKLVSGQELSFNMLNLQLVGLIQDGEDIVLDDVCTPVDVTKYDSSLGLAYVVILKDYSAAVDPRTQAFVGTTADRIIVTAATVATRDLSLPALSLTDSGNYSFVVINNCQNADARLVISGQVRVSL